MAHDGFVVPAIISSRLLRALTIAATLAVAVLCMRGTADAASPAPCSDVLVLGARGSGQEASGTTADGGSGMGPQVFGVHQRLVADLPGVSVTGVAVYYPARGVEAIALDPGAYFSGLEEGVRSVRGTLRRQAAACPDQRFVLAGYSQGAMVMHRAVQDLIASPTARSQDLRSRIDGVILIADGDRRADDRVTSLGSAVGGRGISYADPAVSGVRGTRFPASWRSKVVSVCNEADVICDYRGLLQQDSHGTGGVTVHIKSYTGAADVQHAADLVAVRIR